MTSGSFRFGRFLLDPDDRQLRRDAVPVELNARYLDALALLVREQGRLVSKSRFFDEVWHGVPVTDEALTQCIKALRRQLGDDAARPHFIETVPKHGYRFIAPVEHVEHVEGQAISPPGHDAPGGPLRADWHAPLLLGLAGTAGGGLAGTIGGLVYGFAGAAQPLAPGMGAASVLLVLLCVTVVVALLGGAGVGFGIAAAALVSGRPWRWSILGGAAGGLVVGAVVKLLGLDAFNLLLGTAPRDITGAGEGALLGGAVGLGGWLASRASPSLSLRRSVGIASLVCAAAGALIPLLGGRLMGGSLDLLAREFPASRLRLDQIGALLSEPGFGPISQMVTGAMEGALFGGCIVGAMLLAQRALQRRQSDRGRTFRS
jgi:DNA-binding winged helix-turn-helix (wHTH) protein